jgi:hypothetical protein
MSILYDYLSILEKKRGKDPAVVVSQTPFQKKRQLTLPPAFARGLLFVILGILSFVVFENFKIFLPKFEEKSSASLKSQKPAAEDPDDYRGDRLNLNYSLKGIIYNANSPSAVIDGKIVGQGAKVGDWRVVEILPSEVKMENLKNNAILTLKLDSILE